MQRNTVKMTYNRLENLSEKKSELRKEIEKAGAKFKDDETNYTVAQQAQQV